MKTRTKKHDQWKPSEHSWRMSQIKPKGNLTTEAAFLHILMEHHITGWRRHLNIIGRPDFAFRKQKIAIFIDGCFWHGCPLCKRIPQRNRSLWSEKFDYNRKRAAEVNKTLKARGWRVMRVWEHQLKRPAAVHARLLRLLAD